MIRGAVPPYVVNAVSSSVLSPLPHPEIDAFLIGRPLRAERSPRAGAGHGSRGHALVSPCNTSTSGAPEAAAPRRAACAWRRPGGGGRGDDSAHAMSGVVRYRGA